MRSICALGLLVRSSAQDLFLAKNATRPTTTCADVAPDDSATCAQRLKWGGCTQNYMQGHCCATCFNCDGTNGCPLDPAPTPPPPSPTPPPAPTPPPSAAIRLKVSGKQILDPSGKEIRLTGFNWVPSSHPAKDGEGAFTKTNLPDANVARIVGVLWDNTRNSNDCMTNMAPYWKESCFEDLDHTIKQATDSQMWVILTARSLYGAGQEFQDNQDNVFYNATLRDMMYTMWQHVATRYRTWDYIAAYEIMAEPRDKTATKEMVHDFYEGGCTAVHTVDPETPCMVGPSSYYKLWTFTDEIIIANNKNVIYTFDYFVPDDFSFGRSGIAKYPATYECKKLFLGWSSQCCPKGASASTAFDAQWSIDNFKKWATPIREKHDVPIFINQWGVAHKVGKDNGRYQFMGDLAATMKNLNIGWTWWNWRGSGDTDFAGGSMAFVLKLPDGSEVLDNDAFDAVRPHMG